MNGAATSAADMPRFGDLWPARELGAWIVAIEEGLREPSIEAPFVRSLSLWLRARRDTGMLRPVANAYGRLSWQIDAWNAFADGTDDAATKQMLNDLGHAMHRGFVLTEWAISPGIDPTRTADVAAMHRRIVDQIEKGDTDDVATEWSVTDRRTDSAVTVVFDGWSPRISDRVWDDRREDFRDVVPVPDEGVPIRMNGSLLVFVDPSSQPHLRSVTEIEGAEFDESTIQGRIAYDSEMSKRHALGVIRVEGPIDVLIDVPRNVILIVDQGTVVPGHRIVGSMSPTGDRILAGDVVSIAKASSFKDAVDDVVRMGPVVNEPIASWFLHGGDTGDVGGVESSRMMGIPGVRALLQGMGRIGAGNRVSEAAKRIADGIEASIRGRMR